MRRAAPLAKLAMLDLSSLTLVPPPPARRALLVRARPVPKPAASVICVHPESFQTLRGLRLARNAMKTLSQIAIRRHAKRVRKAGAPQATGAAKNANGVHGACTVQLGIPVSRAPKVLSAEKGTAHSVKAVLITC